MIVVNLLLISVLLFFQFSISISPLNFLNGFFYALTILAAPNSKEGVELLQLDFLFARRTV